MFHSFSTFTGFCIERETFAEPEQTGNPSRFRVGMSNVHVDVGPTTHEQNSSPLIFFWAQNSQPTVLSCGRWKPLPSTATLSISHRQMETARSSGWITSRCSAVTSNRCSFSRFGSFNRFDETELGRGIDLRFVFVLRDSKISAFWMFLILTYLRRIADASRNPAACCLAL